MSSSAWLTMASRETATRSPRPTQPAPMSFTRTQASPKDTRGPVSIALRAQHAHACPLIGAAHLTLCTARYEPKTELNTLVGPIKTKFGYHLITISSRVMADFDFRAREGKL